MTGDRENICKKKRNKKVTLNIFSKESTKKCHHLGQIIIFGRIKGYVGKTEYNDTNK